MIFVFWRENKFLELVYPSAVVYFKSFLSSDVFMIFSDVKKLDRNACVAELTKLHVHLPVKLPNDNSEVSCTVTLN